MIWKIHQKNPEKRIVSKIIESLKRGEIFILPTDTVYAICCLLDAPKSIGELYKIKNLSDSHHLSLLCRDHAMASQYAKNISDSVFRFMKSRTPGPYTYIFQANRMMQRKGTGKKKTVGIRIVDDPLHFMLMQELDIPIIATSITVEDEYVTDPEILDQMYGRSVCAVVDGGIRDHKFSTILDCTEGYFQLIRKGIGEIDGLDLE